MKTKLWLTFSLALAMVLNGRSQPAAPGPITATPAAPEAAPTPAPAAPEKPVKPAKKVKAKKSAAKKEAKAAAAEVKESVKTSTQVEINPSESGVAKQESVNVRGRAAFLGEVITKLKKGESVTLLEEITLLNPKKDEPAKWYKISLPANTPVWVNAEYVDATAKTVVPKRVNVRGGPGENFSILGLMLKGDAVKELRKVNDWLEIEAPASAYAFVAADLIERKGAAEIAATPAPIAPVEPAKPAEKVEVAAEPPVKVGEPTPTPAPTPAPEPAKPAEATVAAVTPPAETTPAPTATTNAAPEEVIKRVVTREGTLTKALNIQAPTDFQLINSDKEILNYLASPEEKVLNEKTKKTVSVPTIDLTPYIGRKVMVTGEEALDRRWQLTPILTIEKIELE